MSAQAIQPASVRSAPGANTITYYIGWLRELAELHQGGLLADEEFAVQRAERLERLFELPKKAWRKWMLLFPLALLAGGMAVYFTRDLEHLYSAGGIAVLCAMAALGVYSRTFATNLKLDQRYEVLRGLLEHDLISADEFAGFEERLERGGR